MDKMSVAEMEPLTSGASNRIIPILKTLRAFLVFLHAFLISRFLRLRRPSSLDATGSSSVKKRWREEEDVLRRRELANRVDMVCDERSWCHWRTSLFLGVKRNALFYRSWFPVTGELRGILLIIHGLNEHSGRYTHFARQLTSQNFGVFAMDWTGHGGSDGLHGYVPSLEHVVDDTAAFIEKIKSDYPNVPCFLFGHSTGGAIVLKASLSPHIEPVVEGIVVTSPALRVQPSHPLVTLVAPFFALIAPKFQFKGANKRGVPVSRDPAALLAKYSDPLVYTGPLRVRTGYEILRLSSFLMSKIESVSVPFLVLHGTSDKVTDPSASQELHAGASSLIKDIKLYDGLLHDLLFEPEKDEVALDIISWMINRLKTRTRRSCIQI